MAFTTPEAAPGKFPATNCYRLTWNVGRECRDLGQTEVTLMQPCLILKGRIEGILKGQTESSPSISVQKLVADGTLTLAEEDYHGSRPVWDNAGRTDSP